MLNKYTRATKPQKNQILESFEPNLDPTWRNLARSWIPKTRQVGPSWSQVGAKIASCCAWKPSQMNSKKIKKNTKNTLKTKPRGPPANLAQRGPGGPMEKQVNHNFSFISPSTPCALEAHGGYAEPPNKYTIHQK